MSQYPGQQFVPAYWYQQYDPMAMGQPNPYTQTDLVDNDWNFSDTTFNAAAYETEQPSDEIPEQPSHETLEAGLVERTEQVTKRLEERIDNLNARLEEQEARTLSLFNFVTRFNKYLLDLGPFLSQMRAYIKDALIVEHPSWTIVSPSIASDANASGESGQGMEPIQEVPESLEESRTRSL